MDATIAVSPAHARALLGWYRELARPVLASRRSAHLAMLDKHAADLESAAQVRPSAEVAFLGSTTAGKSTAINAILGRRILPENRIGSTTAARVVLRHGARERFVVRYVSGEQITADLRRLASDWDDIDALAQTLGEEPNYQSIERLRSIARSALGFAPNHRLVRADIERPVPTDIQALLGSEHAYDVDVEQAVNDHIVGRYWAIVEDAVIELPHLLLGEGLTIVDLPGTGDTDQGRLRALQEYVNRADQFVLVLGIALVTEDVEALLLQTDLMLKLMAHRRPLIVAGTKLDTAGEPTTEDRNHWRVPDDAVGLRAVESIWCAKAAHRMQELMRRLVYRIDPKKPDESDEEYDRRVRTHFERSEYIPINPRAALELDEQTRGGATEAVVAAWEEKYPSRALLGIETLRRSLVEMATLRRREHERELATIAGSLATLSRSELEHPSTGGDAELLEAVLGRCEHELREADASVVGLFNRAEEATSRFLVEMNNHLDGVPQQKASALRVDRHLKSVHPSTARASVRSSRNGVWNTVHVPKALFETIQLQLVESWRALQSDLAAGVTAHDSVLNDLCDALRRHTRDAERANAAVASVERARVVVAGHCEATRRDLDVEFGQVARLTDEVLATARRELAAPCARAASIRGQGATAAIISVVAGETPTVCSASIKDIKDALENERVRVLDAWKRIVVERARAAVNAIGDDLRRTLGSGGDALALIDHAEADAILAKLPAPFGSGLADDEHAPATRREQISSPSRPADPISPTRSETAQNRRDLGVLDDMFDGD